MKTLCLFIGTLGLSAFSVVAIGCNDTAAPPPYSGPSTPLTYMRPYTPPASLSLDAKASRTADGQIVISGTTNLPDNLKLWVEVEDGRLPLGAAKVVASDEALIVRNGQFTSEPLWLSVPNTRFTKNGWPLTVQVANRQKPFPEGKYKIHFESYFNSAWQVPEILKAIGGEGGKNLSGPILKKTDIDVSDSPMMVDYHIALPFPPLSQEAKAISLVRSAILTVPDEGRSCGDIQANIDLYLSGPGDTAGKGWIAKASIPPIYEVSYDFNDGAQGETLAIWNANIASGEVKYVNSTAKTLSWTPHN